LAGSLGGYIHSGTIKGKKRQQVVVESVQIAEARHGLQLSGDPWEDWLAVRALLAHSAAEPIREVAEDAKYLRLLHKGAVLRARLSELWRATGGYAGAASAIRDALLQEHFSASTKVWRGVHVMTIHKSKGKEFDEVLVYDGSHHGRIVRADATPNDVAQARLALRVAVTRAMKRATILTPKNDVCVFL
jgi:DNA helicase-2/ATP-dependent DNA helicase PcrA